ncbi:MAG: hypothetical protein K2X47_14585, partial [Bdellovibrionales bacterium]|nr:hypothetical protein [Bdellovibrionales bacterium]
VGRDGVALTTGPTEQHRVINFFDLSKDVLKNLGIDNGMIGGRWLIQEIRIFFRNDQNYFFNFNSIPVCRHTPVIHRPGMIIQINANSYDVSNATKVSFPFKSCDLRLVSEGECQITNSYRAILE